MATSITTRNQDSPASGLIWTPFLILCLIGAAAALRRILVLLLPPSAAGPAPLQALDTAFAARRSLTLIHLFPALAFVIILPAWFSRRIRQQEGPHRSVTIALFVLGTVIGISALLLNANPYGGLTEQSAVFFYDGLFLFSLARAFVAFLSHKAEEHRRWMMRAIAVILGVATTRPVMGAFFATASRTHLAPQQFFGIAFWIGFTVTFVAGEWYLRTHPAHVHQTA
jgi:hypothetical protein